MLVRVLVELICSAFFPILDWQRKNQYFALLNLISWCLVMVERLFLTVPLGCLQFVIVVFPDHTHLLFLIISATILI